MLLRESGERVRVGWLPSKSVKFEKYEKYEKFEKFEFFYNEVLIVGPRKYTKKSQSRFTLAQQLSL